MFVVDFIIDRREDGLKSTVSPHVVSNITEPRKRHRPHGTIEWFSKPMTGLRWNTYNSNYFVILKVAYRNCDDFWGKYKYTLEYL